MPTDPVVGPFGSWRSPITAQMVARGGVSLAGVVLDGDDLYWLEGRPTEGGRSVLVHRPVSGGPVRDVTPAGYNVRTRVHEYGGGSFLVADGWVFFSNFEDQRLYRQRADGSEEPQPITGEPPSPAAWRYADLRTTGSELVCVLERHDLDPSGSDLPAAVVNEIVALPADGSAEPRVVVAGNDFYSFPRISPDGRRLAWTTWNHPNMPWDGCELWVGEWSEGSVADVRMVAGGEDESICQPEWSPGGVLHFVSDRTGWWNLYREVDAQVEALAPMEAEFGFPQWVFGLSTYGFLEGGRIACVYARDGIEHLAVLDPGDPVVDIEVPFESYSGSLVVSGRRLAYLAGSGTQPVSVVVAEPDGGEFEVVRRSLDGEVDPGFLSAPEPLEFETTGGTVAHALFYPPANAEFRGPDGERPPLLVLSHGGPTSNTTTDLRLGIQFWTSRGFAVVDVNYRGSTGYGRAYRNALRDLWGVADVEDCTNAALHLAREGRVDPTRLAIRGGSAGGYTTLCALTFHDDFAAGASYFGVSDPSALARDTHKFESRYLDRLMGPYPEAKDVYEARSPIHHAEQLATPVILFQGLEDEVVPPAQSEEIAKALERNGVPYAYLTFEGEQHGFRKAETITRSLEAELSFYGYVLRFMPADEMEPVEIRNPYRSAG